MTVAKTRTAILDTNSADAAYSVARVMNKRNPKTTARTNPAIEVRVNTCQTGASETDRHAPSKRKSNGMTEPTRSAMPRMCPALTSGYSQTESLSVCASLLASSAISQSVTIKRNRSGLPIGVQVVALAVDDHALRLDQQFTFLRRTVSVHSDGSPDTQ